jgi:replicative DNA helicase
MNPTPSLSFDLQVNGAAAGAATDACHSEAHERLLIATVARQPGLLSGVAEVIDESHFSDSKLGVIWQVMRDRQAYDLSTLLPALPGDVVSAMGGPAGVAELLAQAPASDVYVCAQAIAAAHFRRRARMALDTASVRVARGDDIAAAIDDVLRSVSTASIAQSVYDMTSVDALYDEYVGNVVKKRSSGFAVAPLDAMIGGIQSGALVTVAGQSGGGKTTLMIQAALTAAQSGRRTVYVSVEMSAPQIVAKIISRIAGVSMSPSAILARSKSNDPQEKQKINDAIAKLRGLKDALVIIHATPTVADLELICQRHLRKSSGLLCCDYLQIMKPPRYAQNREQQVAAIASGLKQLAVKYDLAVLTGSQLNRTGDMRESDAIFHASDAVVKIVSEDQEQKQSLNRQVDLYVTKNRYGPTGVVKAVFAAERSGFFAIQSM